jgi:hypothetical protein
LLGVGRLRVYAGALNLFTWTDYEGWDPEFTGFNDTALNTYPIPRSYQIGLDLQF